MSVSRNITPSGLGGKSDAEIKQIYLANANSTHHHMVVVEEEYRAMFGMS